MSKTIEDIDGLLASLEAESAANAITPIRMAGILRDIRTYIVEQDEAINGSIGRSIDEMGKRTPYLGNDGKIYHSFYQTGLVPLAIGGILPSSQLPSTYQIGVANGLVPLNALGYVGDAYLRPDYREELFRELWNAAMANTPTDPTKKDTGCYWVPVQGCSDVWYAAYNGYFTDAQCTDKTNLAAVPTNTKTLMYRPAADAGKNYCLHGVWLTYNEAKRIYADRWYPVNGGTLMPRLATHLPVRIYEGYESYTNVSLELCCVNSGTVKAVSFSKSTTPDETEIRPTSMRRAFDNAVLLVRVYGTINCSQIPEGGFKYAFRNAKALRRINLINIREEITEIDLSACPIAPSVLVKIAQTRICAEGKSRPSTTLRILLDSQLFETWWRSAVVESDDPDNFKFIEGAWRESYATWRWPQFISLLNSWKVFVADPRQPDVNLCETYKNELY